MSFFLTELAVASSAATPFLIPGSVAVQVGVLVDTLWDIGRRMKTS